MVGTVNLGTILKESEHFGIAATLGAGFYSSSCRHPFRFDNACPGGSVSPAPVAVQRK